MSSILIIGTSWVTKELKYIFFQNNSGHPGLQTDIVSNAKNFINSKKKITQSG